jgi:hypothetical protein
MKKAIVLIVAWTIRARVQTADDRASAAPLETAKAKFAIVRAWTALPSAMNRGLSL